MHTLNINSAPGWQDNDNSALCLAIPIRTAKVDSDLQQATNIRGHELCNTVLFWCPYQYV